MPENDPRPKKRPLGGATLRGSQKPKQLFGGTSDPLPGSFADVNRPTSTRTKTWPEAAALAAAPALALSDRIGRFSLGIGSIRAATQVNERAVNEIQKGEFRVEIYPSGIEFRRLGHVDQEAPETTERGEITEFSDKAARRLREFCIKEHVPGAEVWAFTLTVHRPLGPSEWRTVTKRFRQRVKTLEWAGTWRVELQRRKVPHLHVAFWLSPGTDPVAVRDQWLQSTGEHTDPDALRNACMWKRIESAGWVVYMALHDGKSKTDQLGWQGKQWGVWNREAFQHRQPARESRELSPAQNYALRRFLLRWENAKRRTKAAYHLAIVATGNVQDYDLTDHWRKHRVFRKRLRKLHGGNLLRCLDGVHVSNLLRAMDAGRVSHISNRP